MDSITMANTLNVINFQIPRRPFEHWQPFEGTVSSNKFIHLNYSRNIATTTDTEASCIDLQIPIANELVPSKFYDKRDDIILK